ncbi:MAG: hypothetical protein HC918_05995 [Oscillatoriales cyanobacterium SM2_1_8]|nr:hypothetical protein [Oscillatoriales cyanobacterium SM2_1_8]
MAARDEFHQRVTKIQALLDKAAKVEDLELQGELARYIAVRTSGLIETTVRETLENYVQKRAAPEVQRFVSTRLRRFRNPDLKDILELAAEFSDSLQDALRDLPEEFREAVTSTVGLRNNIAHGGDTSISLGKIRDRFQNVRRFLEALREYLNN